MWSRLLGVGLPFFRSEARRRALGGLALLLALLIAVNGMNIVNSYVGRYFMTALAERQGRQFFIFAVILAGVFSLSTVLEVLARYAEQWLGLIWRDWLTRRLLDRYLAGRTYLQLADQNEIDNPDERISLDVKTALTACGWASSIRRPRTHTVPHCIVSECIDRKIASSKSAQILDFYPRPPEPSFTDRICQKRHLQFLGIWFLVLGSLVRLTRWLPDAQPGSRAK
jgi:ABC-type uncharacterized transport system fused permease/ATPase subunit